MKPKFFFKLIAIALSIFFLATGNGAAKEKLAELVVDVETGKILHDYKSTEIRHPASLTKIMTLYMVFDALERGQLRPETKITFSRYAASRPPSKIGLRAGGQITVRDAVYALITKSANDTATAFAERLGGTERNFGAMMTRKAREIGMRKTVFVNASGLPDQNQITTAQDMVVLGIKMMQDFPQYYKLFATRNYRYGRMNLRNHNNLMNNYKGMDGLKTGYVNMSGFNLVASAERNGNRLIGAVFGGRRAITRDQRMRQILDQSWSKIDRSPNAPRMPVAMINLAALRTPGNPLYGSSGGAVLTASADTKSGLEILDKVKSDIVSPKAYATGSTVKLQKALNAPVQNNRQNTRIPGLVANHTYQGGGADADTVLKAHAQKTLTANNTQAKKITAINSPFSAPSAPLSQDDPISAIIAQQNSASGITPFATPVAAQTPQNWAVQVGAFSRADIAKNYMYVLITKYEDHFANANPQIVSVKKGNERIYRARFAGFTPDKAKKVCSDLIKARKKCQAILI